MDQWHIDYIHVPNARTPQETGPQKVALVATEVIGVTKEDWQPQLLYYRVRLGKEDVDILLDSGASVNYIDEALLERIGGVLHSHVPGSLRYADHRNAKVVGTTTVQLRTKGHVEKS